MYLSKNPTYRFWVTVYAFPALVPLFICVAFMQFVRPTLVEALGTKGNELGSVISTTLIGLTVVLIVLANLAAIWHAHRGLPVIPQSGTSRNPSA